MTRPDSRRRRARDAGAPAGTAPAYVARQIPYYAMLDEEALALSELEAANGKPIRLQVEPFYGVDQYDVVLT